MKVTEKRSEHAEGICSALTVETRLGRLMQLMQGLLELPELAAQMDEKSFMQSAQEMAERLTCSRISFIHFVNDDEETIELVNWSRRTVESYCHASYDSHYPVSKAGIWADALRKRQAVVFNDYAAYPDKHGLPDGHSELKRLISVPVIENGKVIMLTGVGNKETDYNDADIETVQLVSNAIWQIIQRMRHARQLSQLSRVLDKSSIEMYLFDAETLRFIDANPSGSRNLGYALEELKRMSLADVIAAPNSSRFDGIIRQLRAGSERTKNKTFIATYRRRDGTTYPVEMSLEVTDEKPSVFLAVVQDITERLHSEHDLRIAATVFETQECMMITDVDGIILKVNQSFCEITGYMLEEVVGRTPRILKSGVQDGDFYEKMWASINEHGVWRGEIWNRRKNGQIYPEYMVISTVKNGLGIVTNYVASFNDITFSKQAKEEIQRLAFFDALTGLPNRRLLLDRLRQALHFTSRSSKSGALLFIDLDNFKTLNDTLGHDVGDVLLQQVAMRLSACVRERDTVARLGGDEFVIILEELGLERQDAAAQAEAIAKKILQAVNQSYRLGLHVYHTSPSIGLTLFGKHEEAVDFLLKQADIAMYQAKKEGGNTLRFFDLGMQDVISKRANLEVALRNALIQHEFQLYYQIQVDSRGGALGAEALIRWISPQRGLVSPADFIKLAEETGLIILIGQSVLEMACAQLRSWQMDVHTRNLTLAVNVSAKQFRQPEFVLQVQNVLRETGANPALLKLELTESVLLENVDEVVSKMKELRLMGVHFSMDDFGTGYSSLQYIKRLPLDQLKIDQTFVRDIVDDPNDAAIVKTIVAMSSALGLHVIAEGVEEIAQRNFLEHYGCHSFQGYLFGKPLPIREFNLLLSQCPIS